ncbi:MAG TPA: acyltransferase [Allocoleopsis sp.]
MLANQRKIYGFDYLRAVCCILVVIWHFKLFDFLNPDNQLTSFVNIFYYNISLLAVPIFFQISIFLFYLSRAGKKDYLLKSRLPKLLKLYVFWLFFSVIFSFLVLKDKDFTFLKGIKNLVLFIVTGNNSLFYYLFSLIFVIVIAEIVFRFSAQVSNQKKLHCILFFVSSTIVLLLPLAGLSIKQLASLSAYWNPLNFIPYIFSSFLLAINFTKPDNIATKNLFDKSLFIVALVILILVFTNWEWQYLNSSQIWGGGEYILPPYSRLSLIFSALLLTCLALDFPYKSPRLIELVSDCSLGIYCLHTFLKVLLSKLLNISDSTFLPKILLFIITIALSIALTRFFRRVKFLKSFI